MSYDYEYDESGLASSYLMLSVLAPVALFLSFGLVGRKNVRRVWCRCAGCREKVEKRNGLKKVTVVVLWIVVAYLAKNVKTLRMEKKNGFNPLDVLGITEESSAREIKKRLRVLLVKYNPGNAVEEVKKEYEEKMKDVNRAYGLMMNKKKYEAWLNNDSKIGEIVAIPGMIVRNGVYTFVLYCIALGVFVPRWAYRKWREMRDMNRLGVSFVTMEKFFERIDEKMNEMKGLESVYALIGVMGESEEFARHEWKSEISELKTKIENEYGFPMKEMMDDNKGCLVLIDHLFRTGMARKEETEYVQRMSLRLIEGMRVIALAKRYGNVMKNLVVLEGMVVQAVFDPRFWLLQVPFVRFELLFIWEKRGNEKRRSEEYLRMHLSGEHYDSAVMVNKEIPSVEVSEFSASVINTGKEGDGEDVALEDSDDVVMRRESVEESMKSVKRDQNVYVVSDGSLVTVMVKLSKVSSFRGGSDGRKMVVHAPYIKEQLFCRWMVMLTIDGRVYGKIEMVDDFEGNRRVKFNIGTEDLRKVNECKVFVGCGEYLNRNVEKSIVIKVE
ncbi:subunit Sec63 of preprotein translocase [Ordospora colligata]|uniref:Subunit Sec63 of preprotein translocase n=1 Tax=Ordospora colligata OC4 TaxID=1354746 RepID=A0A0B2UKQ3_9MICR|nr:subunit Sec63 of preprotein translocase [Ordospora colligata OC4]KHN69585.1 subunit Sec63 of preprotein translocase [Ordospora colligata OC4]TBU15405.1 subunit Sec63 of preprotein translocase [Ordospora colligata]TBU15505.1 subunit Sec63 of preprotein translocase [Ordospora colligata]TBU18601.1 subunit Sec63 of preprotein translocase [Ordospora colligata]